jgi:hypothetical protein
MAKRVNLDALILREDFEVVENASSTGAADRVRITDLEKDAFFYSTLRKPDFQRETSEWTPRKVCDLIECFLEDDLIPALIVWRSSGSQIFLLDGAHRVSALIAWVLDDYGDNKTSRDFFDGVLPTEQTAVADETRKLIRKKIGTYADFKHAIANPDKADPELLKRAKRLASLSMQLQWVQGDSKKAEASFFRINQQAAPIDPVELKLLQSRTLPNALAARAIIRSGTGHKYWSKFGEEVKDAIQTIAKATNDLLFTPELKTPIKTLDLPIAGRGYSSKSLPLVFDFVNIANENAIAKREDAPSKSVAPDLDGAETLEYLRRCKALASRLSGTSPASLGLHPAVYYYSVSGRYQPTAFLAVLVLMKELDAKNELKKFTQVRKQFEDFLLANKMLVNQVVLRNGSGLKGYNQLYRLFRHCLDALMKGAPLDNLLSTIVAVDDFSYLQPNEKGRTTKRKDFDAESKSAVFLRDAVHAALRCKICDCLLHINSITTDHVQRKADGGIGVVDNGQLAHPYCNTTIKN